MKVCPLRAIATLAVASATNAFAQQTFWELSGSPDEHLGEVLCNIGDIDGDGVDDAAVGTNDGIEFPVVLLVSGATGTVLREVTSSVPYEHFGGSLAGPGDLDGDGVPDFVVGCGLWTAVPTVRAFSGATGALLYELVAAPGDVNFGYRLWAPGDVDGDGVGDLAVSLADSSTHRGGEVQIRSGSDGSWIRTLTHSVAGDTFGLTFAAIGDVNADGVPDQVIGAPNADDGAKDSGHLVVCSGADGSVLRTIAGSGPYQNLGHVLAAVGDLDGDGVSEVLADREAATPVVLSIGTGTTYLTFEAVDVVLAVAGPGDVDQDGWPDLAIAHTVLGGGLHLSLRSGRHGTLLYSRELRDAWAPITLVALGDVDGDGRGDVVTGEPTLGQAQGRLAAIRGPVAVGTSYCGPAVPNSTGVPAELHTFGSDLVSDNVLHLAASGMPTHRTALFLTSQTQGFVSTPPGSQGNLCLGGTIGRFVHEAEPTDAQGSAGLQVDLLDMPPPVQQAVLPGETWNFQTWFRDANPTKTSNFTDAVAVTFS